MTRFARGGSEQSNKRPLDATPWKEMVDHKKSNQHQSSRQHNENRNVGGVTKIGFKSKSTGHYGNRNWTQDEKELGTVYKKYKRSEDRRQKRIQQKSDEQVCFNCRKPGHTISNCPEINRDVEHGTGICFKCGSTEHTLGQCKVRLPPGQFPYAKCFICGETGHLSKACPDNPRGLYPMGGCCNICESVEHYMKDCPRKQAQEAAKSGYCLTTWQSGGSVDDEPSLQKHKKIAKPKSGPKIVKF